MTENKRLRRVAIISCANLDAGRKMVLTVSTSTDTGKLVTDEEYDTLYNYFSSGRLNKETDEYEFLVTFQNVDFYLRLALAEKEAKEQAMTKIRESDARHKANEEQRTRELLTRKIQRVVSSLGLEVNDVFSSK